MDDEVVALWERAAETYETEVPYFRQMGERIVTHAGLQSGESVLDIACGKGATLVPAARTVGPSGRVVGGDIVDAMVQAARDNVAAEGLSNVEVTVMDGEALTLPPDSFDAVIIAFGLGFMRAAAVLPEVARVLRRPGRLITSVPTGGGPEWEFFGELCQQYELVPRSQPGGSRIPSPQEAAAMFGTAGFALQPPAQESVSVTFPDEESWWRWVWSHGQRGFLEQLGDDRVDGFKADAFAALRAFATPEGIPLEQQFLVLTATI
jgi:O-methyltransferase/aklanonic acid methyltransferase